jgi:uncharacterized protein (DUF433 family)
MAKACSTIRLLGANYGKTARLPGSGLESNGSKECRGVAQPGSAPALGAGGRRFKSSRPDHYFPYFLGHLFEPEPTPRAAQTLAPTGDERSKLEVRNMSSAGGNLNTYEERIVRDRGICGGEPVFKGTRVTLRTALASLAAGDSRDDILADFPSLKAEDIQAGIAFAPLPRKKTCPFPRFRTFDEDQTGRESSSSPCNPAERPRSRRSYAA